MHHDPAAGSRPSRNDRVVDPRLLTEVRAERRAGYCRGSRPRKGDSETRSHATDPG